MAYARVGEHLYLHGATGNAMLRALDGADVCVTVTLLDGLVLARSAFHHSMNYRSVVVFGTATTVTDADEKDRALTALVDQMVAGRSAQCRPPTAEELRATRVVRVPLAEASAKVRTGPPIDDPADLDPPVWWGGVVPVTTVLGTPVADEHAVDPG
jgi:nitroimidazol reductase NimA-like FMN-containing flavoprotein (pyridoxamine 5'-phosphate oxidase superfamily)